MMTKTFSKFLIMGMICVSIHSYAQIKPYQLTCEYQANPQAIDVPQPTFRWKINGDVSIRQRRVWIRMASEKKRLDRPDLWVSGAIETESPETVYAGNIPLHSAQRYWWQIRIEGDDGKQSDWSAPVSFCTGLLDKKDWYAQWIGAPWQGEVETPMEKGHLTPAAPLFRKTFSLKKKIKSAQLFCSGLGYFEAKVNQHKVSEEVLIPNQTNYGRRPELIKARVPIEDHFTRYKVFYLGFDVTSLLRFGKNDLDILLGNGFYNASSTWVMAYGSPRMIAQLHLKYEDGSEECIGSDPTWQVAKSAIVWDGIYQGEAYDARMLPQEWQSACLRKAPDGDLCAQTGPSDQIMERLNAQKIECIGPNKYRVDFGEEISGWLRIQNFRAPAGHRIDIKYLSESKQGENYYICNGKGKESYAARFSWFVFRSVEVHNWPGKPTKDQFVAEAVYSHIQTNGHFSCSNPLLNQIDRIWVRSQKDNMHGGIASDCPHRERSAYTGDGQAVINTVMHHFDVRRFYRKWIQDMIDAQNPSTGYVPNGAPWQPGCGGGPAWGAAICIMPWEYHQFYDDTLLLQKAYPGMKAYLSYLEKWKTPKGIFEVKNEVNGKPFRWLNLGDWSAPQSLPEERLVHTFYAWICTDITARTAQYLGNMKEQREYQSKAQSIQKAFIKEFYRADTHSFGSNGANVFALRMGLPNNILPLVVESLKNEIISNNGHLNTGIFGTRYLFEVLADYGLNQLAYDILKKRDFPSFGYWIEQGATTTWERWDGKDSRNHPMFGGGLVWLYKYLCGLSPLQPGFKSILFRPNIPDGVSQAQYYTETAYGKMGIEWKKDGEQIKLKVTVPRSCTGQVHLPIKNMNIDQLRAQQKKNVFFVSMLDHYAEFEVQAGEYEFVGF